MEFITHSANETEALAAAFAVSLAPGNVVAFQGGLGAGKTAFIRGLAQGLGVAGEVSSPTFALVHEYPGTPPLVHFDMYRIHSLDDLYTTGYFDYLDTGAVIAVEWSENISAALDEDAIYVTIEPLSETDRKIIIEGGTPFEYSGD